MIGRIALVGAAVLAAAATSASAQQTQTYAYDVHGRLTGVTRATISLSQTTTYVLDKSDNRSSRTVTASTSSLMSAPSEGPAALEGASGDIPVKSKQSEAAQDLPPNSGGTQ